MEEHCKIWDFGVCHFLNHTYFRLECVVFKVFWTSCRFQRDKKSRSCVLELRINRICSKTQSCRCAVIATPENPNDSSYPKIKWFQTGTVDNRTIHKSCDFWGTWCHQAFPLERFTKMSRKLWRKLWRIFAPTHFLSIDWCLDVAGLVVKSCEVRISMNKAFFWAFCGIFLQPKHMILPEWPWPWLGGSSSFSDSNIR